ncbi:MAG TPA: ABC transporter ATP-binding protein [Micromonosporaceae bacterium]|nr:ABC transporter ATP-binding protein [Micromonosporaceae bacterium]
MNILELGGVVAGYQRSQVLHGVDLEVTEGGVTALLGANGAGKTTTLRAISGMVWRRGTLRFDGRDISRMRPDQVARLGIAHVPQGRGTLARLSTAENLMVGALRRRDSDVGTDLQNCYDLFPVLAHRRNAVAGSLSGGEQQMLAIGRAIMSRPRLLLLDEPSLGLAPRVVREMFRVLDDLRAERGLTMLLVEQSVVAALDLADRAVVLETGRVTLRGSAAEFAGMDEVRRAYLGT